MTKKGAEKKKIKIIKTSQKTGVEKILIENFVSLQKVLTEVSVNFDKLTKQISQLLEIFEISAKNLAEKEFKEGNEDKDLKELMKKIDSLIDQNKLIARGVVMLHEKGLGEGATGTREEIPTPTTSSQITIVKPQTKGVEGYQKSIS